MKMKMIDDDNDDESWFYGAFRPKFQNSSHVQNHLRIQELSNNYLQHTANS